MSLKIAILSPDINRSPKVLAQSLHFMLNKIGTPSKLFYHDRGILARLLPFFNFSNHRNLGFYFLKLKQKLKYVLDDYRLINELKKYSAVVLCEYSPNAFWKNHFGIEKFKRRLSDIPIILYEVYYLGNAPSQIKRLADAKDFGIERYDWHLAVSEVTEIHSFPKPSWSAIGIDLTHTELNPYNKDKLIALVDFKRNGYETYHEEQIEVLSDLGIETIVLKGEYTLKEIRQIYNKSSVYFVQSPEAFGLPIAECLLAGVYVYTPDRKWPMAFRLKNNSKAEDYLLPDIFHIYLDKEELQKDLIKLKKIYDPQKDPIRVSQIFRQTYPTFWEGNLEALREVVELIKTQRLHS